MTTLTSPPVTAATRPLPEVQDHPLLQTLRIIFQPIEYLTQNRDRYGSAFRMNSFAFPPTVILSHPQEIEAIFGADPNVFDTAKGNRILQPLLGERSLLQLDGVSHQHRRKLLMPSFHGQRMQLYGETIREVTQQVMEQWQPRQPFSMHQVTQTITLRTILQVVFGLKQGVCTASPEENRYEEMARLLSEMTNGFHSPWRSLPLFLPQLQQNWGMWRQFTQRKQRAYKLLAEQIQERRAATDPGDDVLSMIIMAKDETGQSMSNADLQDELMTLLFAGHETTASSLAWAFYWIHALPEVKTKVMAELTALGPTADPLEITKLPYLSAVCSETLRIYPVALFAFNRTPKVPFQIMDYTIEPGIGLAPCIYLLHHREDLYPESHTFRPERFLERQFSPYEYIPFGGSNRRCLGYAFAQFEMKLVLATILQQAQLTLLQKQQPLSIRRGFTFAPSGGVPMMMQ
jgi:cytochrome P450